MRIQKGERREETAEKHRRRLGEAEGVVMLGIAQEKVYGYNASKRPPEPGFPFAFEFRRALKFVNQYSFYIQDSEFGLGFIKFSTYAPFPVRVWINGHEWAKRQLTQEGRDSV